MVFASIFALIVGTGIIGQWTFFLVTRQVPELKTEPYRIAFHLGAEFLTATALLVSGIGLLISASWSRPLYLVAIGMLLYTSIVSPGYFAQKREWPLVAMFAVILVIALLSLVLIV
jgi:hypothetical protein